MSDLTLILKRYNRATLFNSIGGKNMNITEYFKRLFGEERNKDVPELQGLEEFINDLIQTKKPQPQELPEYQRKNPVVKTDEEIRKEAQDSLGEYLENSRKNIENDYEQDLSDKLRKKDNYNSQKQSQLDALDSAYSRAFENSNNDSIRRGVARSSIAEQKTKQLGKQKDSEITQLNDEYALKLQEIDSQIETLNAKKQKAINDLEIRYASKLNDKIEELTTQRQKTIEDALEYNNKLEKQE